MSDSTASPSTAVVLVGLGAVALLVLAGLLVALSVAVRRWAREAAAERWSSGLKGRPVPYEPIEHGDGAHEVVRFPDRPRQP